MNAYFSKGRTKMLNNRAASVIFPNRLSLGSLNLALDSNAPLMLNNILFTVGLPSHEKTQTDLSFRSV